MPSKKEKAWDKWKLSKEAMSADWHYNESYKAFSSGFDAALSNEDYERCTKCGAILEESDLDLAATKCYRCRNSISSVSGVGIMTPSDR